MLHPKNLFIEMLWNNKYLLQMLHSDICTIKVRPLWQLFRKTKKNKIKLLGRGGHHCDLMTRHQVTVLPTPHDPLIFFKKIPNDLKEIRFFKSK